MTKDILLATLEKFVRSRPRFEFGNYGDMSAYLSDTRKASKQLSDARELLRYVAIRDTITCDDILDCAQHAFSGRLSIVPDGKGFSLDYTTRQYYPLEYRADVCSILASAVVRYFKASKCDVR